MRPRPGGMDVARLGGTIHTGWPRRGTVMELVTKADVGRQVEWLERDGSTRAGRLEEVRPHRYAVIRYAVPTHGTACVVVSLQGEGADDRVRVIEGGSHT